MSVTKLTGGDDFIREDNIHPRVPKSGYTGAAGDLVTVGDALDSLANSVDRCAANERIYGIVMSINGDATVLSVAELKDGCRIVLPYVAAPTLGDSVEAVGSRHATVLTSRDQVQTDNVNGVGRVIGVDSTSPGGTGTCLVEFRAWPARVAATGSTATY